MRPARTTVGPSRTEDLYARDGGRPRPWRRAAAERSALAIAAALLLGAPAPARAVEPIVTVMLDRAQVMRFPATTETVIVGNPIIADVTMLKNSGEVILTGKGFGDTNLLFLDRAGAVLSETRLRVREPGAMMVVQRGPARETYACQPRCQPTVTLGDDGDYLKAAAKSVTLRNALASGAAQSSGPGQ